MSNVNPVSSVTERLKGTAKSVAGVVLGNDDLKHEGELHKDKAEAATEAVKLET